MINISKQAFQKLKKTNRNLIFFLRLKYVKKEELAQTERRVTELCFIKKISQFLLDLVLVTKYQRKC